MSIEKPKEEKQEEFLDTYNLPVNDFNGHERKIFSTKKRIK